MKLLLKTSLLYVLIIMLVFIIGSIVTFDIFDDEIKRETDKYLIDRFLMLHESLLAGEHARAYPGEKLTIDTLNYKPEALGKASFQFSDTLAVHKYLKRMEEHRKLVGYAQVDDTYLKLSLYDVIVEKDDIMDGVVQSLIRLFIFLGIVVVISSFLISHFLLKPFNKTLQEIKKFNIKDLKPLQLEKTNTKEFKSLNSFIEQMTEKVSRDYRNLKEFSENASHEIQTPLAIAKGKLELLLQSHNLSEEHLHLIETSYTSIDYISKLSKSLTLLTKIENQEFSNFKEINFSEQLTKTMAEFNELIILKDIDLHLSIEDDVYISNNHVLTKILVNNLLTNAIRHNVHGGKINFVLQDDKLEISNTGEPLKETPEALFERFKKDNQSGESMGLGLSIVKKICDVSGYQIHYSHQNEWHHITIQLQRIKTSELLQNSYKIDSESVSTLVDKNG